MRKPKWDTELGRLLWLDGRKDGEIADEFGIPISTVTAYRKRHWEKGSMQPAPASENPEEEISEEPTKPEEGGTEVGESNAQTAEEQVVVYDLLEAATKNMQGIQAICTADAILCLWNWETKEDLLKAKASIDYLLRKLEA